MLSRALGGRRTAGRPRLCPDRPARHPIANWRSRPPSAPGRRKDATAANAWVLQLPPGQERDRASQSVVSSLAETDPQAALNMLQTLPTRAGSAKFLLADLFSLGQHRSGDGRRRAPRNCPRVQGMTTPFRSSPRPGRIRMRRPLSTGPTLCRRARVATMLCKASCPPGRTRIRSESPPSPRPCRRVRMRDQATANIARQWAQNDPTAALAWTQELPAGEGQRRAMQSVLSSWAQSDPTARRRLRRDACRPARRRRTRCDQSRNQLANADVQTALSWAQKLPEGATRQNALNPIVAQWSETDPASARLSSPCATAAGRRAQNLLNSISRQWAQNDPQAALSWAQDLSDPATRNAVLPNIISAVAENDPRAGGADDVASFR